MAGHTAERARGWRSGIRLSVVAALAVAAWAPTTGAGATAPRQTDPVDASRAVIPVTPSRLVETRPGATTIDGLFEGEGKRAPSSTYEVQIAGRGEVPVDAVGAVLYISAVDPEGWGFLTTFPCDSGRPVASSVNHTAGVNVGNEIVAGLSADGKLCIYSYAATHITVDVVGYNPSRNAIIPVLPARVLESREGATTVDGISEGIGRLAAGSTTKVKVTGRATVPTSVDAVVVNVGALQPDAAGFLLVHPCLASLPVASSINYVPGVDRANELITPVNAAGEICVYTQYGVDLIIDVLAYVPAGTNYYNLPPKRYLETRPGATTFDGQNEGEGKRAAGSSYVLQVGGRGGVPDDAVAAIANVSAVDPDAVGNLTVHPCLPTPPVTSSLNYVAGVNGANEIIASLNDDGEMCLFTLGSTHLLVDVTAYLLADLFAATDQYETIGNILLEVGAPPASVPAVRVAGSVLDNDIGTGPVSVTTADTSSTLGGAVTMGAAGTFTYSPPPGVTGTTDTFEYTITDDGGVTTDTGTVRIDLVGGPVWFVDNTAAGPLMNGTSATPFDRLADAGPPSGAGEPIFVYEGDGTDTGYDGGITLDADQDLLSELNGLTIGGTVFVPPGGRPSLSASGAADAVVLGANSVIDGFTMSISGAGAALKSGAANGTIADVDISANSEGIVLDGASGAFTFTDVNITSSGGTSFRVNATDADIGFVDSTIQQTGNAAGIDITDHTGAFTFDAASAVGAANGAGLQFDDADGTYDFDGSITLNGGDAGIDIVGGSAGTFTFPATTTITNPTGAGVTIQDFEAGAQFDYDGSIVGNQDVFIDIDTTAAGSSINFNTTGANSLTSTNNPNGAIFIFDADGDITITTPTTVTDPGFSALFATDGDGIWTFNDLTITDQHGLNGGVDVFGQMGTVNFHNLDITTDSAGTGDATTGFLAGGNQLINVTGNSSVDADGGGALVLINIGEVNMTFQSLTATNNLNSQIGFAGDDGIELLNVAAGSIAVTGMTTITNVDGVAISLEDVDADLTLETVDIDTTGLDAVIAGVVFDNTGTLTINGGTIRNVSADGLRIGSTAGGGSGGRVDVDNVTFSAIGSSIVRAANSVLAGAGNTAAPFSCVDNGGNSGSISFNGGADSCP